MEEMRAHRRLAVDFDAFVTVAGLRDHPCKVRDFCLGGALLSFDDPLRPVPPVFASLDRGTRIDVRVVPRSPGFRDTYTFTASVARRDRQTLGVAFTDPDPTSLMALQSLANVSSAQQRLGARERRKSRHDDATVKRVLAALRTTVLESVSPLSARLLEDVRQPVIDLARRSASNEESARIADSIATLRRYAANLQSAFLQQALKPLDDFDNWQPGGLLPASGSAYRLSLIEKGAFEDWLAIKVMVSRAESECQEPLFELQIRLNELFGVTLGVQNNPVGPAVFFHALGEPVQKLRLPKPVEQLLLRSMENVLLECLQRVYPLLNAILVREGILPDLEVGKYAKAQAAGSPRRSPAAAAPVAPAAVAVPSKAVPATAAAETASAPEAPPVPAASTPPPVPAPAVPASAPDVSAAAAATAPGSPENRAALSVRQFELQQRIARQAYTTVQRLLATRQAAAAATAAKAASPAPEYPGAGVAEPGAAAPVRSAPVWDAPVVDEAIAQIQNMPVANDAEAVVPLRRRLELALDPEGKSGRGLPAVQAGAADTVEELFTQMLATSLLRDDSKLLIRRLDVPFLKLMLSDQDFLGNEGHPARQVLNRLASLGARGAMTTPQQQSRVTEVVENVVTRFERDIAVFADALAALDRMLDQQRRIYQHNLLRVQQSSEGQHRVTAARRKVLQVVERLLGGRRVPKAVLTLLDAGWRESLVSTLLRHGEASEEWREHVDVIQQMLLGVEDPASVNMKSLLACIKKGLSTQASGQINRDAVVSDLREMFTALSSGRVDAVPCVDMPVGAVTVTESATLPEDAESLARWIKRVREIQVGDWVEFLADGNEEAHQARLAWCDEDRSQFVFVNLQGMKVHDIDVESLALALRDTRAWRVEDPETPIVDRGLEAMVQKVYGQLSHRATHDELTGLLNRKEFEKRLLRKVAAFKPDDTSWLLCWLDLDQFKVINSTCGFEAGDGLIREVGQVLVESAGKLASVARLGGDEFAILVPAGGGNKPLLPVEEIINAIDAIRFQWQGKTFPVGASAGVVMIDAGATAAEDLMKSAEAACYAAKEGGRNRVHVYQSDDAQLNRRDDIIKWVSRLNQALENDRLQLRCQRIEPVDPHSGLMPHYEILIAIEDDSGEFIPPSSFMQAAERYNRMHAVDRWVIRNTFKWMHDNPGKMAHIGGFSINLSGQSMNDEKLTSYVLQEVMESAVAREKITFEVTETAAIANLADAADFIREMQGIGCKFSLDDFGSGLSSYSYLKNLPVDFVKIDGVFIRDIHRNASDYMMVRSINEMAHFMGKRTIAEYVESEEILVKLREIGIDFAQGYGIERPRPLDTL